MSRAKEKENEDTVVIKMGLRALYRVDAGGHKFEARLYRQAETSLNMNFALLLSIANHGHQKLSSLELQAQRCCIRWSALPPVRWRRD